jgi:hypothetical protein
MAATLVLQPAHNDRMQVRHGSGRLAGTGRPESLGGCSRTQSSSRSPHPDPLRHRWQVHTFKGDQPHLLDKLIAASLRKEVQPETLKVGTDASQGLRPFSLQHAFLELIPGAARVPRASLTLLCSTPARRSRPSAAGFPNAALQHPSSPLTSA